MNKSIPIRKQTGLSLIELLIAMLIGVFLLAGIASSYVSSKKTSRDTNELSQIEDNGRIALETIRDVIQHAGFTPNSDASLEAFILNPADVTSVACRDGNPSVLDATLFTQERVTSDHDATGDSLAVTYYGNNNLFTDCLGRVLPPACQLTNAPGTTNNNEAAKIYNSFFVLDGKLSCAGSRTSSTSIIADGVENIQYLYGVDTDGDNFIDKYLNATKLNNLALVNTDIWNTITSIQVAILIRSLKPVKKTAESKTYTLLDTTVTSASDKYKREVFTTTIRLRNLL